MNIQDFLKEENKRDIIFYSKVADIQDGILFLKYQLTGKIYKREYQRLIKDELKISQIEL